MMRQRFFEELEAIKAGRDPKGVIRNPNLAQAIVLPDMARELNVEGIPLAEFQNDPLLQAAAQGIPPPLSASRPRCAPSSARRWGSRRLRA